MIATNNLHTYNDLPGVITANSQLQSKNKDEILSALGYWICSNDLEEEIGVRLLHRHNLLNPGEFMLEQEEKIERENGCIAALVTTRLETADYSCNAHANSWKVNACGTLIPLEYSDDKFVHSASSTMAKKSKIFHEFFSIAKRFGCENLLGPCASQRSFYNERDDDGTVVYVERSTADGMKNIITAEDRNKFTKISTIETSWRFLADKSAKTDEMSLESGVGCNPDSYCQAECYQVCEELSPGHAEEHTEPHPVIEFHDVVEED